MKVMVTGHRPERIAGRESDIYNWLDNKLSCISASDLEECITGCAKGVDSIFADVAMHNNFPLVCAFPYKHELSKPEQIMHDYAKEVHWQTDNWYKSCYLDRDKWMVERADLVLVVWDGKPVGGTYYTMEYAKKLKKQVEILKLEDC